MVRYAMLVATDLLTAPLLAQEPAKTKAKHRVDQMLAAHPGIAMMAMPLTPSQLKGNTTFASNISRIGKKADPDNLNTVNNGKTNLQVNKAGDPFEVELPLLDANYKSLNALSRKIPSVAQPWQVVGPTIPTRTSIRPRVWLSATS